MKPYRVLIIDDSLTIRAILETVFEKDREFEVVGVAPDIESARDLIAAKDPNIITLDLALPGIDGMGFLDELREKADHAPIVVISSSTKGKNDVAREAIERGAMACFDKARVVTHAERLLDMLKRAALRPRRTAKKAAGANDASITQPFPLGQTAPSSCTSWDEMAMPQIWPGAEAPGQGVA